MITTNPMHELTGELCQYVAGKHIQKYKMRHKIIVKYYYPMNINNTALLGIMAADRINSNAAKARQITFVWAMICFVVAINLPF